MRAALSSADSVAVVVVQYLAETGLHVAIIAAVVAVALALFGRKLGPRVRYALWGLVVLRLLLPAVPSSPTSVLNMARVADAVRTPGVARIEALTPAETRTDALAAPARATAARTGRTASEAPAASTGDAPTSPASPTSPTATGATGATDATDATEASRRGAGVPFVEADLPTLTQDGLDTDASDGALLAATPASQPPFPWHRFGFVLWGTGALFALLRLFVRERRFERALRHGRTFRVGRETELLASVARDAGVRPPLVLETSAVETPALTGVRRPRLLLPEGLAGRLTDAELAFVFRHELAHLRAGDVAVNWMLALLAAVHWFNPLVHVAFARLRAEREAVRDHTALHGADQGTARAYGETLLRLLSARRPRAAAPAAAVGIVEGRRDLRRRITMLSQFGSHSRVARIAGALLVAVVAAGTLTTATVTSPPASAQDRGVTDSWPAAQNTGPAIRVERERTPPTWERALRGKLTAQVGVTAELGTLDTVIATVRERAGVNVVVHPEIAAELEEWEVDLPAGSTMTADQLLSLALRGTGWAHHFADGAVYVAPSEWLPNYNDRRYYDVLELLDRNARRAVREEQVNLVESSMTIQEWYQPDELIDLVRSFAAPDSWDYEGTYIQPWKALLVVQQSDATHDATKQFLDMLLSRGATTTRVRPEWEQAIARQLEAPLSVAFAGTPLADVVSLLKEQSGVPLVVSAEIADEVEPITLSLTDASAADVLRWIARMTGLHVAAEHGVLRFTADPPLENRCYEVGDILEARRDDDESGVDHLYELIQSSIEPVTWEELPVGIAYWDGLLIVRQTPTTHGKIADFLATVRRALRD